MRLIHTARSRSHSNARGSALCKVNIMACSSEDTLATCWICGDQADTREHKLKKSDLVRRYGREPFDKIGGVQHFTGGVGRPLQGPASKRVMYKPMLCGNCNGAVSQPWDRAYETFELWLASNVTKTLKRRFIPLDEVFGNPGIAHSAPALYKYFVKAFGCRAVHSGEPVPADLIQLLPQEHFLTRLRLAMSVLVDLVDFSMDLTETYLGLGDFIRVDSRANGRMQRYVWYLDIGFLRIWCFYDLEVPIGLGSPWTSDSGCLYLGEVSLSGTRLASN